MTVTAATRALVALVATLAIQIYVSLAASAAAVLAPVIAPEVGLSPHLVGVFVSLVYAGSMIASLVSGGLIARHGPIRLSQVCVLMCAVGLALLPAATPGPAAILVMIVAALVLGVAYGPITPASSQVLARTAPPSRMALTFSIKQTGVPAGAALAGAILPTLALTLGWRVTVALVAASGLIVVLGAQRVRSDLDRDRDRRRPRMTLAGLFAPLRRVLASPILTELTIVAFFYAALQVSLTSFLVVYLTEALAWSLVAAGLALTVATIAGVGGRVLWGVVADARVEPRTLLGLIGIVGGACSIATAAYPTDGPATPLLILCALFGATAIGWNGVQLAELARHSPPGEAATITGAAGFIGFSGVVIGPLLFGGLAAATGDYRAGFVTMGCAILACGAWVLVRARRARQAAG